MNQPPRPQNSVNSRLSTMPSQKPRQLSHLHSQLAQLTAHVSDLENILRMTAVQAEGMRGLGGYCGAMYVSLFVCDFNTVAETDTPCTGSWQLARSLERRRSKERTRRAVRHQRPRERMDLENE